MEDGLKTKFRLVFAAGSSTKFKANQPLIVIFPEFLSGMEPKLPLAFLRTQFLPFLMVIAANSLISERL